MEEIVGLLRESVPLDTFYVIFAGTVCFDIITGMIKAWKNCNFKSKTLRNGLFSSLGEMIVLCICILTSKLLPISFITIAVFSVLVFMVVKELFSILENLTEIGVKFPAWLVNGLKVYGDMLDEGKKGE